MDLFSNNEPLLSNNEPLLTKSRAESRTESPLLAPPLLAPRATKTTIRETRINIPYQAPDKPNWKTELYKLYATIEPLARDFARLNPCQNDYYLYYTPSTETTWGKFYVGRAAPAGYKLVSGERLGSIPFENISTRFREILSRLPIVALDA